MDRPLCHKAAWKKPAALAPIDVYCIYPVSTYYASARLAMIFSAPKSEELRLLYWRSEILRVVYWLRGEGLGDLVDVDLLRQYLDVDAHATLSAYLDVLVQDGSLVRDGEWYALSAGGLAEGQAQAATAFTDHVRPVVNECDDECWCQTSAAEAEACSASRARAWVAPARSEQHDEAGKANA